MLELRRGDRRAAFDVPFRVYGKESPYVSPMRADFDRMLDPTRNPLVTQGSGHFELYTAHRDGQAVGRIIASVHEASNRRFGTRRAQFGFFDCANDTEAASALLGAAESYARKHGCEEIAGNFNLTAMQMMGVLTAGFDAQPYTDMMWNPPHIGRLLEANGYAAAFPMMTFEIELDKFDPEALLGPKQRAILAETELEWQPVTRKTFTERMADACRVLNEGFDRNPMFVPLTPEEFNFQAGDMSWIMDFRLPVIVRHERKPVGTLICIPDMNPFVRANRSRFNPALPWHFLRHRLRRRRAVIVLYSVAPGWQNKGLNGAMLVRVAKALKSAGYERVGGTWIADVNGASLRQAEKIGAKQLHRLHLFGKTLHA